MLESNKIIQGAATNHIRFDCIGNKLTLYVNGNKLVDYQDSYLHQRQCRLYRRHL